MRRHALVACVLPALLGACASSIADADPATEQANFTKSLGNGPAIFVLDHVDSQNTDPITLFDHVCQSVRYQTTLRDTVMLWSDGRARRAFAIDELTDGAVRSSDHLSFSGHWTSFTQQNAYYFSDGPSIQVSVAPDSPGQGTAYEMNLRIVATNSLATLSGLGGSCPGSANDGHEALFTFTRR
jgi:hypothetical protein